MNKIMTDEEIVKMDFYDICGVESVGMADEEKIKYWREFEYNSADQYHTGYIDLHLGNSVINPI